MPVTLQEFKTLTPDQLRAKYDEAELRSFAQSLRSGNSQPDGGFGNRGGILDIAPVNPKEDFLSSDNLGRMVGNIPGSAVNMGKDVFNAVTSPVETATALYEAGPSGILSALGERFGNIKKTAVEDPFGLALDVAPVGTAVGGLAKAGKLGGTAARVAETASRLNPATGLVRGTAATAKKTGQGLSAGAREATSITTGIDPGVFSTARKALTGSEETRQTFKSAARRQEDPTAIPDGVRAVVDGLRAERNNLFNQAAGELERYNIRARPERLQSFRQKVASDLQSQFNIDADPITGALNFEDVGGLREAPRAVQTQLNKAFQRVMQSDGNMADLWKARMDIDRIGQRAQNARATKVEAAIFSNMRDNISDFLNELGGPQFRDLNKQYAEASRLIEDFSDISNARGKTQQQINSVVRSIREQSRFSEDVLQKVEQQTGVPLRALAAGTEFSEGVARGLIGRSKFAEFAFAGAAAITANPMILTGLLFTSPKLVGRTMEFLGAGERVARQANSVVQKIMSIPGAEQLAEQGLTVGAIMQQLEREQSPSLLGALGATRR